MIPHPKEPKNKYRLGIKKKSEFIKANIDYYSLLFTKSELLYHWQISNYKYKKHINLNYCQIRERNILKYIENNFEEKYGCITKIANNLKLDSKTIIKYLNRLGYVFQKGGDRKSVDYFNKISLVKPIKRSINHAMQGN